MLMINDLRRRFEQQMEEALRMVEERAREKDSAGVKRYAQLVDDCEKALGQLESLEETAKVIEAKMKAQPESPLYSAEMSMAPPLSSPFISPKARGMMTREDWVRETAAREKIALAEAGRLRYTTADGRLVGIAYGAELKTKPDRWFLGIPNEKFDIVVILCGTKDGGILDFIVPMEDLETYWDAIAESKVGNQKKLNITKRGGNYYLLVPGGEQVSIGGYLGNFGPLKK